MKTIMRLVAAIALLCASVFAQNFFTVSGSNVINSSNTKLPAGTIYFSPVNNSGQPISYTPAGGGQATKSSVNAPIVNGAFSITLPNTTLTQPANVCFKAIAKDVNGNTVMDVGYGCVQTSGVGRDGLTPWCNTGSATCNFDNYAPNLQSLVAVQAGPAGPTGPAGAGFISGLSSDGSSGITVAGAGSFGTSISIGSTIILKDGAQCANLKAFGAKGDNSTDDTTAVQNATTYAISNAMCLYVPPGKYRVKRSINATTTSYAQGFWIFGNGQGVSEFEDNLVEAYPVFDFGGCTYCGVRGIGIEPFGGSYSNTSSVAGIFVSKGTCGASGSTGCSTTSTYGDSFSIENSSIAAGKTTASAAVAVLNADLFKCDGCKTYSNGTGIVDGFGLGDATDVVSKFYTTPTTQDSTFFYITGNAAVTGNNAAVEPTGTQALHASSAYFAITGAGNSGKIINNVGNSGLHNGLILDGVRTENQSSATGVYAIYNNQPSNEGLIVGVLNTDSAGIVIGSSSTGTISNWHGTFMAGASSGNVFSTAGQVLDSNFQFYSGSGATFGSMSGAGNKNLKIIADAVGSNFSWATVSALISNQASVAYCQSGDNCYFAGIRVSSNGNSFVLVQPVAGSNGYAKIELRKDGTGTDWFDMTYWNENFLSNKIGWNDVAAGRTAMSLNQGTDDLNVYGGYQVNGAAGSGNYLRGNGTDFVSNTIQAADVPTLNQSTTGNAATATNLSGGAVGSIPYQSAASTSGFVSGNTAATDQVLTSTGTGSAAQAPTLKNAPALSAANMTSFPTLNQNTTGTASNLSGTPALPNGTTGTTQSPNDNSTKVATDAYVDGKVIYRTWAPSWWNGALSSAGSGGQWTPLAAITIDRLEVVLSTNPSGCSTAAVVGVYDQTGSTLLTSLTMANGTQTYDSGSSSLNIAVTAGHVLRMRINTADSGCSPAGNIGSTTMTYH